jgi:hypothetical protein
LLLQAIGRQIRDVGSTTVMITSSGEHLSNMFAVVMCGCSRAESDPTMQAPQAFGVAIREVSGNRDPLPSLGPHLLSLGLEFLDDQVIEQRRRRVSSWPWPECCHGLKA